MNSPHSLDQALKNREKNAYRYWYSDGWAEIGVGLLFVAIGLLFGAEGLLSGVPLSPFGLPIVVLIGIFAVRWFVRVMKERVTYPRSGFVAFQKKPEGGRLRPIWLGLIIGIAVGVISGLSGFVRSFLPLLQGGMVGLFLLLIGHRIGLLRYYGLAILVVLWGVLLSFTILVEPLRTAVTYGGIGLLLLATGVIILGRYLALTKRPHKGAI